MGDLTRPGGVIWCVFQIGRRDIDLGCVGIDEGRGGSRSKSKLRTVRRPVESCNMTAAPGQLFDLLCADFENPQLGRVLILIDDNRWLRLRPQARLFGEKCDQPAIRRPFKALNRTLVKAELRRLAAQDVDQKNLRTGTRSG